ncbi:hypothetical protein CPAST_c19710 [Clostridium pasteurianum DSM 525 = ATCC 6013]|uniref:Uncharacterized protein n=1 Tax=Clostridium pasteurianum DSM 525 = ATCC 6013 TaxID=1262449 RepID=A0A0H3J296_CLOPA|nr:hypothetical protein [Clostridium pasteurianum]AJA48041.1 hypothetical protein CPAST_c19710 [Clostridium pasteurianum DSM 525 = ATCC 6013]AJA52029.1 hypothetical protein CLPA_c19710 [Clostridium pasteurianum DSM 525 = ATCC 6013]AOZ77332.1 hypothetical protein AQ983_09570 [Clostridium pasteurianum DSM 525 = ATCC 6013]AOZ81129.1 hypothetical protein AQ984_09560 [Clostridium pasteurianum]ELP59942.1 hypothetical protein F502_08753 [Clostridium pasteurianum DSM 525 = ATCC 6013]
MSKTCIFDIEKACNNCGDCNICDLDVNKICNNCGNCLDLDGDKKSILIDGIIEDPEEIEKIEEDSYDYDEEDSSREIFNDYDENYVRDEKDDIPMDIELIDDIDGLKEILESYNEDEESKVIEERYPGFFIVKKKK